MEYEKVKIIVEELRKHGLEEAARLIEVQQTESDSFRWLQKHHLLDVNKMARSTIKTFAERLKCGAPQETGVIRCDDVDLAAEKMLQECEEWWQREALKVETEGIPLHQHEK